MVDDVPEVVKARRLSELIDAFQTTAAIRNSLLEVGRLHLVLIEGLASKQTRLDMEMWTGRTDTNKRVIFGVTEDKALAGVHREGGIYGKMTPLLQGLTREEALFFGRLSLQSDYDGTTPPFHNPRGDGAGGGRVTEDSPASFSLGSLSSTTTASDCCSVSVATAVRQCRENRIRDSHIATTDSCSSSSIYTGSMDAGRAGVGVGVGVGVGEGMVEKSGYVIVKILGGRGHTLRGAPIAVTTLQAAYTLNLPSIPTHS